MNCKSLDNPVKEQRMGLHRMRRINTLIDAIAEQFAALACDVSQYQRDKIRGMIAEQVNIACALMGYGVNLDEAFGGEEDEI